MTPFSMDLMEDIMYLTSFSSYHNDVETAKPVYNCWGRRRFLLPLDDVGLPDVAYRSLEPDRIRLPDEQCKIKANPSVEPMYGKGRARILKDHALADGINSWNTIRPPLNEDMDDVDPDRFQYDFDSAIQAECAEFGTAHFVDALPSVENSDNEKNWVTTKQVDDWLVNNDHVGDARSKSPRYARKVQHGRLHSKLREKVFKTGTTNHYHPKTVPYSNENPYDSNHIVATDSPKVATPEPQETTSDWHKSDSSLVNSHNDTQDLPQCEHVSRSVLEISNFRDTLGISNSPVMINGSEEHIYVSDEEEENINNACGNILEKPKTYTNENSYPFPGFPVKDNIPKISKYLPAGYERKLPGRLNGECNEYQPHSTDDEQDENDFTFLRNGGNDVSMYANTEIPTARVTFGDYISKSQKLKCVSKTPFKGKRPAPELREEFFPDLHVSQPSSSEPSVSSTEEVLSFNMKDLAATLLGSSQGLTEKVEDIDESGHGDGSPIAGKFLEIDGLPEGIAAKELKDYLEIFGNILKVDFFPSISGKGARVFMQDTSLYEWIKSCLNGVTCPIGDAPVNSILTLKIMG